MRSEYAANRALAETRHSAGSCYATVLECRAILARRKRERLARAACVAIIAALPALVLLAV